MISPNLSLVSNFILADDSPKVLKTGSGAKLDHKEVGKIQMQGEFQCLTACVAHATGQVMNTHFCCTGKMSRMCSFIWFSELESLSVDMIRWLVT
jgi:hypothetical protein